MSVYSVLMVVVHAGTDTGLRKFIAEDRSEPRWSEAVFGFYFRLAIIIAVVVSLILFAISWTTYLDRVLDARLQPYFLVLSLIILISQVQSMGRSGLMGLQLEHYAEPLRVLREILFGVLAITLIYLGWDVMGALIGYLLATGIVGLVSFVVFHKHIPLTSIVSPPPRSESRYGLFGYNALSVVLTLFTVSLYNVDILMLQPIVGSEQTGYYRAALMIAEFLWFVPMAIQILFVYSFSEMWSKGQQDRINTISSRVTRYVFLLTSLVSIGLVALADPFMPLYFGSEFSAAILPMLMLLPGALCFAVARPIFSIGMGKDRKAMKVLIIATGSSAILNIVLNYLFIPRYGMYGASVATSIGYASMLIFHIKGARVIGFDPIVDFRIGRIATTAALSAVAIIGFAWIIPFDFLSLLIVPPVGFLLFTALAYLTGAIDSDEIREAFEAFPEPVRKKIGSFIT